MVIFPNIEETVIAEAERYLPNFDTIIGALVDDDRPQHHYGAYNEDLVYEQIFNHLGISEPIYLDAGVCHPVLHNNTYLLYEQGKYAGVLVEPNPDMCKLARIYRPNNRVVEAGVGSIEGNLKYYIHPDPSLQGVNTFDAAYAAKRGIQDNYKYIPVMPLNQIIEEYFDKTPNLLDLELQGLEYDSVAALDTERYKVDVIRAIVRENKDRFIKMIEAKGYIHFMNLEGDRGFYLRQELLYR